MHKNLKMKVSKMIFKIMCIYLKLNHRHSVLPKILVVERTTNPQSVELHSIITISLSSFTNRYILRHDDIDDDSCSKRLVFDSVNLPQQSQCSKISVTDAEESCHLTWKLAHFYLLRMSLCNAMQVVKLFIFYN